MPFSRRRFLGFVRAYYPWAIGEPQPPTIATRLYETRNVLAHELGIGDLGRNRRRHDMVLVKPDPPLEASDVVDLEIHAQFPLAGAPVTLRGSAVRLSSGPLLGARADAPRCAGRPARSLRATSRGVPHGAAGAARRQVAIRNRRGHRHRRLSASCRDIGAVRNVMAMADLSAFHPLTELRITPLRRSPPTSKQASGCAAFERVQVRAALEVRALGPLFEKLDDRSDELLSDMSLDQVACSAACDDEDFDALDREIGYRSGEVLPRAG